MILQVPDTVSKGAKSISRVCLQLRENLSSPPQRQESVFVLFYEKNAETINEG